MRYFLFLEHKGLWSYLPSNLNVQKKSVFVGEILKTVDVLMLTACNSSVQSPLWYV